MIAIFNKGQFVGFWGNKISDNFIKATCNTMKWNVSEVQVFDFGNYEDRILTLESSGDVKKTCDNTGRLLLQRIALQDVTRQIQVFPWDEQYAKELFTEQEISEGKINHLYIQQNPDAVVSEYPYPSATMTSKGKWIIEKQEVYSDIETIQGVVINVVQKIAEEESQIGQAQV